MSSRKIAASLLLACLPIRASLAADPFDRQPIPGEIYEERDWLQQQR